MRRHTVLSGVVLAATCAGPAYAQDLEPPRARQGYYFSGGTVAAVASIRAEEYRAGPILHGVGLEVGQLLTNRLGLGLGFDYGSGWANAEFVTVGTLSAMGQVVLGFDVAVHAGVGLGVLSITGPEVGLETQKEAERGSYTTAYSLGVTHDWFFIDRSTGGWAITPSVWIRAMPASTTAYVGYLGVAVTWWSGLPTNQLALEAGQGY